jgi:hypothetical protein
MENNLSTHIFSINESNININAVDFLLEYLDTLNTSFFLDTTCEKYSFVEKIIYDVALFHINRLQLDIKNKHVSFWSKSREYMFDYLHMHIDHCDYESEIFNRQFKTPIFTSLLYFNDNNCPTLLTDVTLNMKQSNNFMNDKNTKLGFSFPRQFKNITFDSGNYYHGESYLYDYKQTSRKVIVIAVWDEINKPYYIPYFKSDLFYYHWFSRRKINIEKENNTTYYKSIPLMSFENTDNNIITIKIHDKQLITNDFFHDVLVKKDKKSLYKFKEILEIFVEQDTFILDFSDL